MSSRYPAADEGLDESGILFVCRACSQDARYAHLASQLTLRLNLKGLEISCGIHGHQSYAEVTDDYTTKVMSAPPISGGD